MIDKIGFIVLALLLFATFNGVILKWHNLFLPRTPFADPELEHRRQNCIKSWNKWWHRNALAIRVSLWIAIWLVSENWLVTILIIIADCLWYPILINLINCWKWYHIGTTAWWDIQIRKLFPKINFD
jgi:hypothetical protein